MRLDDLRGDRKEWMLFCKLGKGKEEWNEKLYRALFFESRQC